MANGIVLWEETYKDNSEKFQLRVVYIVKEQFKWKYFAIGAKQNRRLQTRAFMDNN